MLHMLVCRAVGLFLLGPHCSSMSLIVACNAQALMHSAHVSADQDEMLEAHKLSKSVCDKRMLLMQTMSADVPGIAEPVRDAI